MAEQSECAGKCGRKGEVIPVYGFYLCLECELKVARGLEKLALMARHEDN